MSFFHLVADELAGKFNPVVSDTPGAKEKLTLHGAIRSTLGTNPDWALLAYRNHVELLHFVNLIYAGLTEILKERADTWALREKRQEEEVLALLNNAHKTIDLPTTPIPVGRPGMRKIGGAGKSRGVVVTEIASIAHHTSRHFADVFGDFLRPQISDMEMITALDHQTVQLEDESEINWSLPKLFSTTMPIWLRTSETTLISDFCFSIYDEWSGIRDDDLSMKLKLIVEEAKRTNQVAARNLSQS